MTFEALVFFVIGGFALYSLMEEEGYLDIEEEEEAPKLKAPPKPSIKKMKMNGQWVDVIIDNNQNEN